MLFLSLSHCPYCFPKCHTPGTLFHPHDVTAATIANWWIKHGCWGRAERLARAISDAGEWALGRHEDESPDVNSLTGFNALDTTMVVTVAQHGKVTQGPLVLQYCRSFTCTTRPYSQLLNLSHMFTCAPALYIKLYSPTAQVVKNNNDNNNKRNKFKLVTNRCQDVR